MVIIPADIEIYKDQSSSLIPSDTALKKPIKPGDFIVVDITESNSQVLKGIPLYHTTISEFDRNR